MFKYILLFTFFFSLPVQAKYSGKIIEVKRALPLDRTISHHKEFYLNVGSNSGLKKNHIIPVLRKKTLIDPLANLTAGDLFLPVGEIKIIHVDLNVSVARIHKVPTRQKLPELEYATFMVGDRLNVSKKYFSKKKYSTVSNSRSKKWRKKKSAQRGIASVKNKSKAYNGNYSFPKVLRKELSKKTIGEGLELEGTSATGVDSQYKIKPN